MWETQLRFLGQEGILEKGMATTPVFLSGEFHGQRSLADNSPWGHKESDTLKPLSMQTYHLILLPEEFYGQKNLAGNSPWGHKESDMTEQLTTGL